MKRPDMPNLRDCLKAAVGPLSLCALIGVCVLLLGSAAPDDDDVQQSRKRLDKMTAEEKKELADKKKRFDELSPADQKRLRDFHAELATDPNGARLEQILERYTQWLRALPPAERSNVMSLPPDQRMERIKQLTQQQEATRFRQMLGDVLQPEDRKTINAWLEEFVSQHEQAILDSLPKDRSGFLREGYDPEKHRRYLVFAMAREGVFSSHREQSRLPEPNEADHKRLIERLSSEAREFLEETAEEDQTEALNWWIGVSIWSRMRPQVSQEKLNEFAIENLDRTVRERLEAMPRDRMYRELQRLYYEHQVYKRGGGGDPGFGRRGGGRFGRGEGRGGRGGRGRGEGSRRDRGDDRGPRGEDRGAEDRGSRSEDRGGQR